MNRIILIGNGFDIANGLETRYSDFIVWLWKKLNSKYNLHIKDSNSECVIDGLVTYIPFSSPEEIPVNLFPQGDIFINEQRTQELCKIIYDNIFLKTITTDYQNKNWVDIEEDYFNCLKECLKNKYVGGIVQLNNDFDIIKTKLGQFLSEELNLKNDIQINFSNISQDFLVQDFNSIGKLEIRQSY